MAIVESMLGVTELPQQPPQPAQPAQPGQTGELPPNMARAMELARQVQAASQDRAREITREQLREQIRAEVRRDVTREIHQQLDGNLRPDQVGAMAQQIAEQAAEQAAEAAAAAVGHEVVWVRPGAVGTAVPPTNPRDQIPPQVVDISIAFFASIVFCIVGLPIARAWARRMDRRSSQAPAASPEITNQLRQLQQSVEAVAIEVERISEAQRFSARLLSEGAAQPVEARQGERVGAG